MTTKNLLVSENAELKNQLAIVRAERNSAIQRADQLAVDLRTQKSAAALHAANELYWRDQLQQAGDAWAKKYLALEDSAFKTVQELAIQTTKRIHQLQEKHQSNIKDCAAIAALEISRAESKTLAYAFEHVTHKLAEGSK